MAEGHFRPLKPFLALTHILSVCLFYFTVHENWKHLMPDIDRLSPEMIEEHRGDRFYFGGGEALGLTTQPDPEDQQTSFKLQFQPKNEAPLSVNRSTLRWSG